MIDIRQPNITAKTEKEQIAQIRTYLYQMAQQLQWAFNTISGGEVKQTSSYNPENISSNVGDAGGGLKNFVALKNMIIKSADIVEAFRTEITRTLNGKYVSISDFGIFQENTTAKIDETDTNITQNYTNIQKIQTNVSGIENVILEMNAYIRTGHLYDEEDGTARYGVEIGEQMEKDGVVSFKRFSRLTSDRLSFFDQNGIEVAYISDRKLHITSAEVEEIDAKRIYSKIIVIGSYVLEERTDGHFTIS